MLDTGRDECVEGAFSTYVKLCEDCQDQLDSEEMETVLNGLIQVFYTFKLNVILNFFCVIN